MTANWHRALAWVLIIGLTVCFQEQALARDVVSTSFTTPNVDLIEILERQQTGDAELLIELPADSSGAISQMTAVAQGEGTYHRWGIFSLRNQDPVPRDLVVTTRHWGFVGSGLVWPNFSTNRIISVQSSPGLQPLKLISTNMDAYHFRINPGETITYAIEWAQNSPENLTLWQRPAYDVNLQKTATFYGLLLGFALLLLIAIICLFVIRPQMVFPAGVLFVGASLVFLAGEFGYLTGMSRLFPAVPDLGERVRAMSEALMCAGLIACFITFVELRKRMPFVWFIATIFLLVALSLAAWAWIDPERAAAASRITFLFASLMSLICVIGQYISGGIRAKASLVFFAAVLLWALVATAAVFKSLDPGLAQLAVICGLILLMAIATLTLGRFAFNQGVIHSRFFEDSGRRALALAGSEQSVWDWDEEQRNLYVGPELERALGYGPGKISKGGVQSWMSLIHPADKSSYISGIEAAIKRGRGGLNEQFRLRKSDGTYRWYELRGSALPGEKDGSASRCIGTLSDITTGKRAEDSILFDAVHDRITKLPNRALFLDRLQRAMRREIKRDSGKLAVIVVDLDRFKNVNDGLGHLIGDSLLLTMARRLRGFVEADDTLARIAGDQFGLIVNAVNPSRDIAQLANVIQETIAHPIEINSREVFLTASVGIVEFQRDTENAEEVFKDAEIALYEAKRQGTSSIEFFNPSMRDGRSELVHLEAELRRALERNEIEVVFQPITRLQDQELAGFEALIRWRHRERGLLLPDEFLGVAEETGLISEMGEFVLNEAARQLGVWQRAFRPHTPLFVAVNLSHNQLLGRGLVDEVKAILSREDLVPGTFKIEITESMVMENPELSVQVLDRLKRLDVGLSCDDFGTGYSSLAMLERLPFDTLKLDKSFLESDPHNETAAIILETVINLAHDLNLVVVAEGVETVDQVERLRVLECDLAQGFHFGEPMSARKVIETLGGSPFSLSRHGEGGKTDFLKRIFDGRQTRAPDQDVSAFVTKPNMPSRGAIPPAASRSRVPPPDSGAVVPAQSPLAQGRHLDNEIPENASPSVAAIDDAALQNIDPSIQPAPRMDQPAQSGEPSADANAPQVPPPSPPAAELLQTRVLPPPAASANEPEPPKDDLRLIVGVGDTIRFVLRDMGFNSFTQIAELTEEEAETINGRIGFPGRVQDDLWIEQANNLTSGGAAWTKADLDARAQMPVEHVTPAETDNSSEDESHSELEVLRRLPIPRHISASEDGGVDANQEVGNENANDGEIDDLTKIRGIGPAIGRDLNDMKVFSFEQLADMDDEQADNLNEQIGFPGRVQREVWREQARALMAGQIHSVSTDLEPQTAPDQGDDISLISGIGPAIARDLMEMGIVRFEQVSTLNAKQIDAINEKIGFPGRVEREQWREQARELMAGLAPRAKIDREAAKRADEQDDNGVSDRSIDLADADDTTLAINVEEQIVPDDLTRIKGIGAGLAKILTDAGITSFAQIAELDEETAIQLEKKIGFKGRISREKWRDQAREFLE